MSEFTEIMRQAKRLCAAHGGMCNMRNCPLDDGEACRLLPDHGGEDYNELERIIMGWAAEHPEPVYPSWEEGWRQLFPGAITAPCIQLCTGIKCTCHDCSDCGEQPIPAEVAEKLGIKLIDKENLKWNGK